ncbi:hypothetical protein PHMEG_0008585 [Phytophthora megakarya]|uniref:Uncharacterized protein n=1 Tax=Phytophthora megakarya TaxID=4795 RepID=A0A225WJ53_9STRA|nr:hypothetical protein PHMEG_0008585 [Phytophthora megakarya]
MDVAGEVVEAMISQGTRTFLQMAEALREFGESAPSIVQLPRKQNVHNKVTIVFPKNYVAKGIAEIKTYRKYMPTGQSRMSTTRSQLPSRRITW